VGVDVVLDLCALEDAHDDVPGHLAKGNVLRGVSSSWARLECVTIRCDPGDVAKTWQSQFALPSDRSLVLTAAWVAILCVGWSCLQGLGCKWAGD
jgi:hypothetical protein